MIKSVKELSELMTMYNELPKDQKEVSLLDIKSELMKILNSLRDLEDKIVNQLDVMDINVECDCDKSNCPICSGEGVEESELSEIYSEILDDISKKDYSKVMLLLVNLTKDIKPIQKVVETQKSEANPEKRKFKRVVSK
jgi:hypothetical protein